ncbi:minor tail protein [Gordonia phage Stultus]|uniref:Minor tail protein n=2 Tax=Vividuovirus TaxID=2560251 RepID=A0A3G3M8U3_9CAUD|nr:minor tail protein [Gordonia phage Geodirt]YP_010099537.1 minor tail protein [Gordonia phage Stultus]AYR02932.1 hypothetical protein SEA_GEODIRT_38 [Gordonia phage Geodirt]AYR03508.1 minor tail protein [Gordonia phage Stultus]
MAYTPQTWVNKPATTTPLSAARLNYMESGIAGAHTLVANLDTQLDAKADLDGNGKLLTSQLPDMAIVDYLGTVGSEAAMLALNGQRGDWAIRSDIGTVWIIIGATPSNLSSWQQTAYPASPVASVAGKTGAVTLVKSDVGLGSVDNTADSAKVVASAAKWTTARTVRTNLASTTAVNLDGTANITPGVTGTLPVANGGTGGVTAAEARTALELGNVNNTADVDKPISSAVQTALDGKVDEVATANVAYGTKTGGVQGTWPVTSAATATTLALRGTGGTLTIGDATASTQAASKGQLDAAIAAAQLAIANAQSAAYTLALTDANKAVEVTSATGVNVTVPPNSAVAFPVGTLIEVAQTGAGQLTLVAGAGVTLRTASSLTTRAQWSTVTLRKRATDEWVVAGDLT